MFIIGQARILFILEFIIQIEVFAIQHQYNNYLDSLYYSFLFANLTLVTKTLDGLKDGIL